MVIGKVKGISSSINFKQILISGICIITLSSCSSYSSSFGCGDARGANCLPMDKVDQMIASGEIERFSKISSKCKGRKCSRGMAGKKAGQLPEFKIDKDNEIQFINQEQGE